MNIRMCFSFMIDEIITYTKKYFLCWLSLAAFLTVLMVTLLLVKSITYEEEQLNRILSSGTAQTGAVDFQETALGYEEICFISEKLGALKEVGQITTCSTMTIDSRGLASLKEIQGGHISEPEYYFEGGLEVSFIQTGGLELISLSLAEGGLTPEQKQSKDMYTVYLYLGSAYSGIPIGTVYQNNRLTYIVAGILEEGSSWIANEVTEGNSVNDLTYGVVAICSEPAGSAKLYYTAAEGYTLEDTTKAIRLYMQRQNISAGFSTIAGLFYNKRIEQGIFIEYLKEIAAVLLISAVLILLCIQSAVIMSNQSNYGIMYANGMMTGDLYGICILHKLWDVVTGIAVILILTQLCFLCFPAGDRRMYNDILSKSAIWYMLLGAFLCEALSLIVPMCLLHRMTPVKLMGQSTNL